MAITRRKKEAILKNLNEKLEKAKILILLDYQRVTVPEIEKIRKELKKINIDFLVVKKTLIQKALAKNSIKGINLRELKNQVALVSASEADIRATKIIKSFQKETKKTKFLKGILDGKILEKEDLEMLATIPGREELLAKVLGSISSPISGFVYVLKGNLSKLVFILSKINK